MASSAVCGRRVAMAADLDAAHQRALGDEVGAHFARADDADADGLAGVRAGRQIAREAGQVDVGDRWCGISWP